MFKRISFLLVPLLVVCTSAESNSKLLRAEPKSVQQQPIVESAKDEASVLSLLMKKIESLEEQVQAQKRDFDIKLQSQNTQIQALEYKINHMSSHRLLADDSCGFTYDNVTDTCFMSSKTAFLEAVEMTSGGVVGGPTTFEGSASFMNGLSAEGDIDFKDTVFMLNGAYVQKGMFRADGQVLFNNGLEVFGLNSTFWAPTDFLDDVKFTFPATFEESVHFTGDESLEVHAPVHFYDNVKIDGPSSSDDSTSTDFEISGHVNVDFIQDEPMDVKTFTRFRDNVLIREKQDGEKTTSSDSTTTSADEDAIVPTLVIGGDVTAGSSVQVGQDLTVLGETTMEGMTVDDLTTTGDASVGGSLTVSGSTTLESDATVEGDLTVDGAATVGSIAGDDGTLDVTGNLDVSGKVDVAAQVTSSTGDFVDCSATANPLPTANPLCPQYIPPSS